MINKAYITLLSTSDYLEAVLVLNRSLRTVKSRYPLIAACTPNIYCNKKIIEILNKEQIIVEKIKWYEYTNRTKDKLKEYNLPSIYNVGSKIKIFGLKKYSKLIYLDADSIIVKNIDRLFTKKDGSSLCQKRDNDFYCFCALFVFCPKNHSVALYEDLMTIKHINDGTVMELMWWHLKDNKKYRIHDKYFYTSIDEKLHKNIRAYHLQLSHTKYWKLNKIPDTQLANKYKTYLISIRKQYKEELQEINK